jgi:hypothetical protein
MVKGFLMEKEQGAVVSILGMILFAIVLRRLFLIAWRDSLDPFGRVCKIRGLINHPQYELVRWDDANFLQIDVEFYSPQGTRTLQLLMQYPEGQSGSTQFKYVYPEPEIILSRCEIHFRTIFLPWHERGFVFVQEGVHELRS